MSVKYNRPKGGKKARNYGGGGGMLKHAQSGHAHNHRVTIELNREAAKELEKEAALKKKRKGKMYGSVAEVFKDLP